VHRREGVLAGTALVALPQTITMKDVILDSIALARFNSLQLSDLDLSKTSLTNLRSRPLRSPAFRSRSSRSTAPRPGAHVPELVRRALESDDGRRLPRRPGRRSTTITNANVATVDELPSSPRVAASTSAVPLDAITVTGDVNTPRNVLGISPLGVVSVGTANVPGSLRRHAGRHRLGHTVGHTVSGIPGSGTRVWVTPGSVTPTSQPGVGHTGVGHTT